MTKRSKFREVKTCLHQKGKAVCFHRARWQQMARSSGNCSGHGGGLKAAERFSGAYKFYQVSKPRTDRTEHGEEEETELVS